MKNKLNYNVMKFINNLTCFLENKYVNIQHDLETHKIQNDFFKSFE